MFPSNSERRYQQLAEKWLNGTVSDEEAAELAGWYNECQDNEINLPGRYAADDEQLRSRMYSVIDKQLAGKKRNIRWIYKWTAAAVMVSIIAGYLYFSKQPGEKEVAFRKQLPEKPLIAGKVIKKAKPQVSHKSHHDIIARGDNAVLTLGDGRKISLDHAQNGIVARQGNNSISKTAAGELVYSFLQPVVISHAKDSSSPGLQGNIVNYNINIVNYNIIETLRGGKFQVRLPDGSRVWLNAASSLRFPSEFTGIKRTVELRGEAYFEVAPDSARIFEVTTRNQTVQVLGTHFNINAYADEPSVNTTLLEGSVRISDLRNNTSQMLKPGEQSKNGDRIEIMNLKNSGDAVAWKAGYFQFNEADIQTVMRQIGRWYDVSVRYEGPVPTHLFGGEIERNLSLLQVLKILEKTRVHFRLEGNEVIVMP